jgi:hypothetical protein
MPSRTGAAHVVTTTRKYKGRVYHTHLLPRSYREAGTVKNETLGNLSHLPESLVDIIRRSLQGETFVPLAQAFAISCSRAHGHVQAVATAMHRLGFAALIAATPCRFPQGKRSPTNGPCASINGRSTSRDFFADLRAAR